MASGVVESKTDAELLEERLPEVTACIKDRATPDQKEQVVAVFRECFRAWLRPRSAKAIDDVVDFEVRGKPVKQRWR